MSCITSIAESTFAHSRSFQRNQRDSPFLRLPSEIRNKIYFFVASGPLKIVLTKKVTSHHCPEPNLCPQKHYRLVKSNAGLAVACRQIRHDMWKVCALELPSALILPELPLPLLEIFNMVGFTQCTQIKTLHLNMTSTTFRSFVESADLVPETRFARHWWNASGTFWGLERMIFLRSKWERGTNSTSICERLNMQDLVIEYA